MITNLLYQFKHFDKAPLSYYNSPTRQDVDRRNNTNNNDTNNQTQLQIKLDQEKQSFQWYVSYIFHNLLLCIQPQNNIMIELHSERYISRHIYQIQTVFQKDILYLNLDHIIIHIIIDHHIHIIFYIIIKKYQWMKIKHIVFKFVL